MPRSARPWSSAFSRGAHLADARLIDVNFAGARLDDADLASARISATTFRDASLRHATLGSIRGHSVCFGDADLREAFLAGAKGSTWDMSNADLRGADFVGSGPLTALKLYGVKLEKADLRGARVPPQWGREEMPAGLAGLAECS